MNRTEFLATLQSVDQCPGKATRVAQRFMRIKGYPDVQPLGVYVDDQALYYYYRLPEGILEVELTSVDGRWLRQVTDFITAEKDIQDMLGENPEPSNDQPKPEHESHDQAPSANFKSF